MFGLPYLYGCYRISLLSPQTLFKAIYGCFDWDLFFKILFQGDKIVCPLWSFGSEVVVFFNYFMERIGFVIIKSLDFKYGEFQK